MQPWTHAAQTRWDSTDSDTRQRIAKHLEAITAGTPAALEAVHGFLRYQIQEHRTGDPLTVRR